MKVICVNDKERPNEVPLKKWVKKGQEYHISKVAIMKNQGGIGGVQLEEIDSSDLFPYTYFRLDRFGVHPSQIERLIEQGKLECEQI
jgi:hypothetical protein